jgi:hypothetical protein
VYFYAAFHEDSNENLILRLGSQRMLFEAIHWAACPIVLIIFLSREYGSISFLNVFAENQTLLMAVSKAIVSFIDDFFLSPHQSP